MIPIMLGLLYKLILCWHNWLMPTHSLTIPLYSQLQIYMHVVCAHKLYNCPTTINFNDNRKYIGTKCQQYNYQYKNQLININVLPIFQLYITVHVSFSYQWVCCIASCLSPPDALISTDVVILHRLYVVTLPVMEINIK